MIEIKEIKLKNLNKNLFFNFVCFNFRYFIYDIYWRVYFGLLIVLWFLFLY